MAKGQKMALVARRYLGVIEARKAGLKARERITVDELAERFRNDFLGFCALLDIIDERGQRRKLLPLLPTQARFNDTRTGRDIVLKPRRVAITTLEVARDIWFFLTRPSSAVVIMCQSITDHSPVRTISGMVQLMFEALERANVDIRWKVFSGQQWQLEGRQGTLRIVEAGASLKAAEKKGRAGAIHRLHVTEIAFFEFAEETLNATLKCVPDRALNSSEVVMESTPNGAGGYFYEKYQDAAAGKSEYRTLFLRWSDRTDRVIPLAEGESVVPNDTREARWLAEGVRPEQIKWYRRQVADSKQRLVDQEYPSDEDTCWLIEGRGFFDQVVTQKLLVAAPEPIETARIHKMGDDGAIAADGELRVFHRPEKGQQYIIAVDTSEGGEGKNADASAAHVYERGTGRLMAVLDGLLKPWALARELGARSRGSSACLGWIYNGALIAVERQNHGHAVLRALHAEQQYTNIFFDRDGKPGWLNHEVTRAPALDTLEEAHRAGHWKPADRAVLKQLRTFVVNDRGKPEAARGSHDDHVLAGMIGWDVLCRPIQKRALDDLPYA